MTATHADMGYESVVNAAAAKSSSFFGRKPAGIVAIVSPAATPAVVAMLTTSSTSPPSLLSDDPRSFHELAGATTPLTRDTECYARGNTAETSHVYGAKLTR